MRTSRRLNVRAAPLVALFASVSVASDLDCLHCRLESWAWRQHVGDRSGHFDEATGRDRRNYPPHRWADHGRMTLELFIQDMDVPVAQATQTLTITPIAEPLEELRLDARLLDIRSVSVNGFPARFTNDGRHLRVALAPPLPPDVPATIVTTYVINDPPDGLFWTPSSPAWPGRPPQIHTQGQPETNSYWFPCHDFPNERLETEIIATVPAGFLVSSNGRLLSQRRSVRRVTDASGASSLRGYDTFHWLQDKPHVNYLVSLVVGKFDVVDVGRPGLPMPVYVPPGRGPDVRGTYGRTAEMTALFERLFDEPYPWDRYAQLVVWNFGAGGMENTAATTMFDTAIISPEALIDHDLEGLISHELAHQWFGDLITCNSWDHIWLNEGFATYLTALWFEHSRGRDAYDASVLGGFDAVIARDNAVAPLQPAMVSREYTEPWDVFRRAANPYPKGASVLHMLRRKLGDGAFFRAVGLYVDRYKGRTAETDDFRKILEEVSGESLERFFHQWCYRPGVPRLRVRTTWNSSAAELRVDVEQMQNIDERNPAFVFDLPVLIRVRNEGDWRRLHVDGRSATLSIPLAAEPDMVAIDPNLEVLASIDVDAPSGWLVEQALRGPTHASRVLAVRSLGTLDTDAPGTTALHAIASDRARHRDLRSEAVRALAARRAPDAARRVVSLDPDDPYVRETVLAAVADCASGDAPPLGRDAVADRLAHAALHDASSRVRAAAVRGLARMNAVDRLPVLLAALEIESQHDTVRQAALGALADLDQPDAISHSVRFTRVGTLSRTRAVAIGVVGRLGKHDPDIALNAILPLLEDREMRARNAAGEALVTLGDARAVERLEALAATARDPAIADRFRRWADRLRDNPATD
ncbi:MAG: hypothetical protein KIS87_07690 [Phycisphaeraceae bacterium]|nr:hypothetical protein [Phycisphaeraceae bacterium]